ncbi:hypothetical protein AWC38_SpisGene23572 [Stylophora pistillata]|uniref:Uncharacterized protein n=1 Tax=Stylophora pistillata TaxID=50429 RepID=A0A2B4R7X1_STYPI|nr:hypothetical protein AWC38_SpisGene23572 [Stylophora pistillata]
MEERCKSINMGPAGEKDKFLCQLSDSDHLQHPNDLKPMADFVYRGMEHGLVCFDMCSDYLRVIYYPTVLLRIQITLKTVFNAVFTNLNASGRFGPTTLSSHYTGQDYDGQVTLSSGIEQWTVPYSGEYRIEAIGAAGGYDKLNNSALYRRRGARMIGTFSLNKSEVIQILIGQEGGINKVNYSSGGGGGTFVVRGANKSLIIAGRAGGIQKLKSRHSGCDASSNSSGNPGYKSWSAGSNGYGAQIADTVGSGGGGGGFYSSGRSSVKFGSTIGSSGEGGKGFLQGGVGGRALFKNIVGGFGGGGGVFGKGQAVEEEGGYSGGGSGDNIADSCGGDGGSYNAGKNQHNECCYRSFDHGQGGLGGRSWVYKVLGGFGGVGGVNGAGGGGEGGGYSVGSSEIHILESCGGGGRSDNAGRNQ